MTLVHLGFSEGARSLQLLPKRHCFYSNADMTNCSISQLFCLLIVEMTCVVVALICEVVSANFPVAGCPLILLMDQIMPITTDFRSNTSRNLQKLCEGC